MMEPSQEESPPAFASLGVSAQLLVDFIETCGCDRIKDLTTDQVCKLFILPQTEKNQCSYCEMVLMELNIAGSIADSTGPPPPVATATVFLSHCWQSKFLDVVNPLLHRLQDPPLGVAYVWFDLFSNNQHSTNSLPFEWWSNTFKSAISSIGHTIITLNPWDNPVTLGRAWCCYELFCSIEAKSKVEILMSDKDVYSLTKALLENFESINNMIARVDIRTASATRHEDKLMISEAVQNSYSGYSGVNTVIFERLMNWLGDMALDLVGHIWQKDASKELPTPDLISTRILNNGRNKAAVESAVKSICIERCATDTDCKSGLAGTAGALYVLFMCNAGRLLKDLGRFQDGLVVLQCAVDYAKLHMTMNSRIILSTRAYLGEILIDMGRDDDSDQILTDVLNLQKELFGESDEDTIITGSMLCFVRLKQGRLIEAEALIKRALKHFNGVDSIKIYKMTSHLAMIYTANGDYFSARDLHKEAYDYRVVHLGISHPDTMCSANNLAHTLWKLGNHEEALRTFEELLQTKQAKLGRSHPSSLSTMSNLGGLYRTAGRLGLAESMMREVIELRTIVLGKTHPSTLISSSNLSGMLKDLLKFDEAAAILQFVWSVSADKAGILHTNTLTYKSNLALVYAELGEHEKAEVMLREVLAARKAQDGENHVIYLSVLYKLGNFLSKRGESNQLEAFKLLTECYEKRLDFFGETHADTVATRDALAGIRSAAAEK